KGRVSKTLQRLRSIRLWALNSTGWCVPSLLMASSVSLRPVADTTLFATFPDNNLGASTQLVGGGNGHGFARRALIRFDPASQIPTNAVVQSVTLTLKVVQVPSGGGIASAFDLRRVLVNWSEGKGTGNSGTLAKTGEVTWNDRVFSSV